MSIANNYKTIKASIPKAVTLVVVTKTQPIEKIMEVYNAGARAFGENKVQELINKQPLLPNDVEWHLIGHLQTNKVKYIAPFVKLIHSVDSVKLLKEINKEALKNNRVIHCLLQVHIAQEETKFGFDLNELDSILKTDELNELKNIVIVGLMGMATNTDNEIQIESEFISLKKKYETLKNIQTNNIHFSELSMGMSSDYSLAIKNGSTLVRIGSSIFGLRA
jgi:pyridoxal phosphate enzyme (YggS family)